MGSTLGYVRSAVLVSLVLSLSSASHVLGAGHLPPLGIIALLGALLLVPITLLTRRALSFRSIVLVMGAGQLVLHTLFELTAAPASCLPSAAQPGHHAAFELACSPVVREQLAGQHGVSMLLLHAVATLVLALAVARSDAAVVLLAAWLRPLVTPSAELPAPVPAPRGLVPEQPVRVPPLPVHASVPTLRGPPRPLLVPSR